MISDVRQFEAFAGGRLVTAADRAALNALSRQVHALSAGTPAGMVGTPGCRSTLQPAVDVWWDALIVASELQSGHQARWNYTGRWPLYMDPTQATGYALADPYVEATIINLRELAHIAEPGPSTAWYVWGVDAHGTDYGNTGFAPRPVGGGGETGTHKVDIPVRITTRMTLAGDLIYVMSEMGSHDGAC